MRSIGIPTKSKIRFASFMVFLSLSLLWSGCGGDGKPALSSAESVTVSSNVSSTTLYAGASPVTLTASIMYDLSNSGVTWSAVGCGALASSGTTATYTPPSASSLNADCQTTITATAVSDSTKTFTMTYSVKAIAITLPAGESTTQATTAGNNLTLSASITNGTAILNWNISTSSSPCGSLSSTTGTSVTYIPPNGKTCTDTIVVTNNVNPNVYKTFTVSVSPTILPLAITTVQGNIASGETGQLYAQLFNASGGSGTYIWSCSGLPTGLTQSTANLSEIIGKPATAGIYNNVTVTVTDSKTGQTASQTFSINIGNGPDNSKTSLVNGPYSCYFHGYKDDGTAEAMAWTMKANVISSNGVIKALWIDVNSSSGYSNSGAVSASSAPYPGSYSVGSDMRGILSLTFNSSTSTFALAAGNLQAGTGPVTELRLTRIDDVGDGTASGQSGEGHCFLQNTTYTHSPSSFTGGWVFGLSGTNSSNQPEAIAGVFTGGAFTTISGNTSGNTISPASFDKVPNPTSSPAAFAGGFTADTTASTGDTGGYGRLVGSNFTGLPSVNWVVYLVDANRAFMMSTEQYAESSRCT